MIFFKDKIQEIKNKLSNNEELVEREIVVGNKKICLFFIKGMIDRQVLVNGIVAPLISTNETEITMAKLCHSILKTFDIKLLKLEDNLVQEILTNRVLLFLEDSKEVLAMDIEMPIVRSPTEPPTSPVIQGPREGFTESLNTNITLIRRRFTTSSLCIESLNIGKQTNTKVSLVYLKNIADKQIVQKIKKRLKQINIDGVVDSYYLVEFLKNNKYSLFKQVGTTEKPDILSAKMLEGRVGILVNGSPIALTLPFLFFEDLQSSNDYYTNNFYVSFIRIIRGIGLLVATVLPGFYLSLRLYHNKIMPIKYLVTIANSTLNLPFTPFIEILFILILFQILYEVSLRLPSYLGLATSIVGALILGDTGVKAGLISPPSVIIVALSLIAIYTVPDEAPQLTILRFLFILIGGCLGLVGIIAGMIYVINYLGYIDSYGTPYLAPYAPKIDTDLKDGIFKKSLTEMKERPKSFKNKNKVRIKK